MSEFELTTSSDARIKRAHYLKSKALQLLSKAGDWEAVEGYPGRVRSYHGNRLFILHRTPFQPPPVSEKALAAGINSETQRQVAREYGLDIWVDNKKTLSLIWNEGDNIAVVLFKSGVWEEELIKAAKALGD